MIDAKEIVNAIEAMDKQRIDAVNESNELRLKLWNLQSELDEMKKEVEKWKNIAFGSNTK